MNVLLINPKGIAFGINLGIHYLASNLKKHGHNVLGLDLTNRPIEGDLKEYTKKKILKFKPNLIGISLLSFGYDSGIDLINDIGTYYWCPIVIGGAEAFIDQEKYIKENNFLNFNKSTDNIVYSSEALSILINLSSFVSIFIVIFFILILILITI